MDIKIQSIHFDATEKLEAFVEKKVAKLEKSFEDIQKVEVQLKVVKPATAQNKEASLTVAVPGNTLFVEKTTDTFEESIDLCVDSMRAKSFGNSKISSNFAAVFRQVVNLKKRAAA